LSAREHALSYNQLFYTEEWGVRNAIVQASCELEDMDIAIFRSAVESLLRRHDNLRARFMEVDGKKVQRIIPVEELELTIEEDVPVVTAAELRSIVEKEAHRKFDLYGTTPLFSIKVLKIISGNYIILITTDHAIFDGYSIGVLEHDLRQLYAEIAGRTAYRLEPLPIRYTDFPVWQKRFLASAEGLRHKKYWLNKLKDFNPVIDIVTRAGGKGRHDAGWEITTSVEGEFYKDLQRYAQDNSLTTNALLIAGITLLLNRVTGREDVTILTTTSARFSEYFDGFDLGHLTGCFVNFLFVRNTVCREKPLLQHLKDVQDSFLDDLHFGSYPFAKLIYELPEVDPGPAFLCNFFFYNYLNFNFLKESVSVGQDTEHEIAAENLFSRNYGLEVAEYKNCITLKFILSNILCDPALRHDIKDLYFAILKQIVYSEVAIPMDK